MDKNLVLTYHSRFRRSLGEDSELKCQHFVNVCCPKFSSPIQFQVFTTIIILSTVWFTCFHHNHDLKQRLTLTTIIMDQLPLKTFQDTSTKTTSYFTIIKTCRNTKNTTFYGLLVVIEQIGCFLVSDIYIFEEIRHTKFTDFNKHFLPTKILSFWNTDEWLLLYRLLEMFSSLFKKAH